MVFRVDFTNTSSETGTVLVDVSLNYSDKLSEINTANIKISGSSTSKRSLIEIGSTVKIYRDDTLEFHGICDDIDFFEGGGISIHASGYEKWLAIENGAYAGSPWTATASATIFSAVLAEASQPSGLPWTEGTVDAGTSVDFRATGSDSLWNVLKNLAKATVQDIGIDYPNTEIDILDHKGSSTSVLILNAGIQMGDVRVSQSYPLGNDIRVYGQSEGQTRIQSDAAQGQDASSKSTYGTITKIIRDPKITTVAQANIVANAEVARYKDPIKVYDFEVLNPTQSLVSGDIITLNARSQGLEDEEVRIVKIERGRRGDSEYMTLSVTNAAYAKIIKNSNEIIAETIRDLRDQQTYDGYQDEYTNQINTTTNIGGVIDVYPSYLDLNSYTLGNAQAVEGDDDLNLWSKQGDNINIFPWDGECNIYNPVDMQGNRIYNTGTHYWSCPASNFHIGHNAGTPGVIYTAGYIQSIDDHNLEAPVFLPNGAVITAAIVYGNSGAASETWLLRRATLSGATLSSITTGSHDINSSAPNGDPLINTTVDNSTYSYVIVTSFDTDDRIYGARITYTL